MKDLAFKTAAANIVRFREELWTELAPALRSEDDSAFRARLEPTESPVYDLMRAWVRRGGMPPPPGSGT